MTKLQFGLQIYSVRDHCQNKEDMLACLKGLKAMGYNVCQMAGQSRDITPAELRALLDESGMECPAIHTSYERMRDDFDAFVRDMKTIGCRYLGIGMPGEYRTPEGIVRAYPEYASVVEASDRTGATFQEVFRATEAAGLLDAPGKVAPKASWNVAPVRSDASTTDAYSG